MMGYQSKALVVDAGLCLGWLFGEFGWRHDRLRSAGDYSGKAATPSYRSRGLRLSQSGSIKTRGNFMGLPKVAAPDRQGPRKIILRGAPKSEALKLIRKGVT